MDIYLGLPNMIVHNAGTQFISSELVHNAKAIGSTIKCVPVEVYYLISIVEHYYAPL